MAMPAGQGGVRSEINITPLVDVVLVLLIIFMVAAPVMQMGLDVEVPPKVEALAEPPKDAQSQIVVIVRADGFYVNDVKVASVGLLEGTVRQQLAGRAATDRVVFVNAEDQVPFDRAVAAMDAARSAGAEKVGFLTDAPRQAGTAGSAD